MLPASFRGLVLGALVAPLVLGLACSDLKHADDANDGGTSDDGSTPVGPDGEALDGNIADADPDVGQPPDDSQCGFADAWTKTTKANAACNPRQVFVVEADPPFDAERVSIARTPAGRIGIAYTSYIGGADEAEMRVVHFVPSTPTFTPVIAKLDLGFGMRTGARTKIAASGPDVLHVLSHDVQDGISGDVVVRRITNGAATLPMAGDAVATGVPNGTELGFAIDATGTAYATIRVTSASGDGGTTAKLTAYRKIGTGPFQALQDLESAFSPTAAPGAGETSLLVTPGGQLNALYHYVVANQTTWMRHKTLDNALWSPPKSIDAISGTGVFGYSPALAVYGTRKIATYVARKANQTPPITADIKIARWQTALDNPTSETLDQGLTADNNTFPFIRVAAAVDKYGLEHVVFINPDTATSGHLAYMRQTRSSNGDIQWLRDTIDPDVLDSQGLTQPWVDLVVDENARPHIAYLSAKDGKVRYATRFDR